MTVAQRLITIAMCVLGTQLMRWLPFLVFPAGKPTPRFIRYLGHALPAAVFGMLLVYCLRSTSVLTGSHGLPELFAILIVAVLHLWKRQMLLSIAAGTVAYMLMIQFVFA